ncbi:hypothetical protein BJ170DRAFT_604650 [Xylariales sp. AK1849]|nr:hypothetical protein BJ170DRAFT_604650 [Xylariales sp. AK1849]
MSVSSPLSPQVLTDITCIVSEPFIPKPLIADILRTRYCITGSIFLVEGVDIFSASKSRRWRAIRLILGDGELCIQALLSGEMHRYVDGGDVTIGAYVKLETFRLECTTSGGRSSLEGKEKEPTDASGTDKLVYLVVEDLIMVGWNNRLLDIVDAKEPVTAEDAPALEEWLMFGVDCGLDSPTKAITAPKALSPDTDLLEAVADADDDFEVMHVSQEKMTQKRGEIAAQNTSSSDYSIPGRSNHLPWSSTDPTRPLKLTPLRSIPNLPYKQNWSTNILAVISSISGLEASTLPPFNQRIARLAHPSTSKQVHLTVFLDPQEFTPEVGSVVLLLGVKNHRFDGGSLKKYASDRPRDGGRWWYENPTQFQWCDVEGYRKWWDGR